jgi:hypothetical protein
MLFTKEMNVASLVIPAWIAGIQKPGMAKLIHPYNLDLGTRQSACRIHAEVTSDFSFLTLSNPQTL